MVVIKTVYNSKYVGLHNHTEFSNLRLPDCTNKVEELIQHAKDLGLSGIAITDHEALSAHVRALKFYQNQKKEDPSWEDFTLILGNEIYLTEDGVSGETVEKGQKYPHLVLLAKDFEGHKQLRQLSSRAWQRSFTSYLTRVPTWKKDLEEIVGGNKGHIVATSACLGGPLGNMFQQDKKDMAGDFISWSKSVFENDFYLELQPALYEDQKSYNKWLVELSSFYSVPMVVATDAHFLSEDQFDVHEAFLRSRDGERETADFYKYTYLMTAEEIVEKTDYIPLEVIEEALGNTIKIASQVESYSLAAEQGIPRLIERDMPDFDAHLQKIKHSEYKYINLYKTSSSWEDRYLIFLILEGLEKKIEVSKKEKVLIRINQELEELWEISINLKQTVGAYMLTLRNIINRTWEECNSLVGIARGSAGAFVINYLIGITQMNPLEQGLELPHWRFIHKDRPELPDGQKFSLAT